MITEAQEPGNEARLWLVILTMYVPAQEPGNKARLWLVILIMYVPAPVPSCFELVFVVWLARTNIVPRKIACSFAYSCLVGLRNGPPVIHFAPTL